MPYVATSEDILHAMSLCLLVSQCDMTQHGTCCHISWHIAIHCDILQHAATIYSHATIHSIIHGAMRDARGWTEIENIGELLKRCCNYLCFLKNYVSESRSPDRPHFAAVAISTSGGVPPAKRASVTFFNAITPLFGINRR